MSVSEIDGLLACVTDPTLIGQRAGDFILGRSLSGGVAAWGSGRCFNEQLEIRWWPDEGKNEKEDQNLRRVLVLNCLPEGWNAPQALTLNRHHLAEPPDEKGRKYLCVGQFDERSAPDRPVWWETRYGRSFEYLNSPPPTVTGEGGGRDQRGRGRVYLRAVIYVLANGGVQHRLVHFEHASPGDVT